MITFLKFYLPTLLLQLISGWMTVSSLNPWYAQLKKTEWTPPGWIFGPVWTVLYILMSIAITLVYDKKLAILFFIQLFFNFLWSILFFGLKQPGLALIDLIILVGLVGWMGILFAQKNSLAGLLILPYFLWICYATFLNWSIWRLN